jgi:hypothetical protein
MALAISACTPEPEPLRRRLHPSLSVSSPVSSPFLHTVISALLEQLALLPAEERSNVLELSCPRDAQRDVPSCELALGPLLMNSHLSVLEPHSSTRCATR